LAFLHIRPAKFVSAVILRIVAPTAANAWIVAERIAKALGHWPQGALIGNPHVIRNTRDVTESSSVNGCASLWDYQSQKGRARIYASAAAGRQGSRRCVWIIAMRPAYSGDGYAGAAMLVWGLLVITSLAFYKHFAI
jgi:hypothetical protein